MKNNRHADIEPSTYSIDVGYVTPFVVFEAADVRCPVAAFHSIGEAKTHFPSAKVTEAAEKKALELAR